MSKKARVNLQPHLGRVKDNYKPQNNMGGYLALAKVIKVHHKHGTVDLQIVKSNDIISSNEINEGKFGARVVVSTAHFNRELMSSSGVIEPIQEGQLVVLAFLDSFKNEPIVLGSFHETWEMEHNILPKTYPLDPRRSIDDLREAHKYLRVFPSQFYHRVDGVGAVEVSHPSRTFLIIDPDFDEKITDKHEQYDHNDLSEKDPFTGKVRSARIEEALMPIKMLFVHRSSFMDDANTWTKFFIDRDGSWRVTRDNHDDKLTYIEMSAEGKYKIRRQNDSPNHGEGEDYSEITIGTKGQYKFLQKKTDNNVEVSVDEQGAVKISRNYGTISSIEINKDNSVLLKHGSGSYIKLDENGDIIIQASRYVVINGMA